MREEICFLEEEDTSELYKSWSNALGQKYLASQSQIKNPCTRNALFLGPSHTWQRLNMYLVCLIFHM